MTFFANLVPLDMVKVRIPIIPGYTTKTKESFEMEHLKTLGCTRFDIFHYVTSKPSHFGSLIPGLLPGKAKCKVMKRIRDIIADVNGIEKSSRICMNKGECAGTCPLCEKELLDLTQFISKRSFQNCGWE